MVGLCLTRTPPVHMRNNLSIFWNNLQYKLFPRLEEHLPPMLQSHYEVIAALELIKIERFIIPAGWKGRPPASREALARALVAKHILNLATTEHLHERLLCDKTLRMICGWERYNQVPSLSTFSRAFLTFSHLRLPEMAHNSLIKEVYKNEIVGHLSRDSTDIPAREKSKKKGKAFETRKSGGPRSKGPGKCEQQLTQTLETMLNEISTDCDFGSKVSSKGHRLNWIGYKFHVDVADGAIPISCKLTSASVADPIMAIPLSIMSSQKVNSFYEVMDKAYYVKAISQFIDSKGRKALISECAKTTHAKAEQELELKARAVINWKPPKEKRQECRTEVERFFSNLKDNFCGRFIRVKGHLKVSCHLMFSVIALTAIRLLHLFS
jgi:hypothetical protein